LCTYDYNRPSIKIAEKIVFKSVLIDQRGYKKRKATNKTPIATNKRYEFDWFGKKAIAFIKKPNDFN